MPNAFDLSAITFPPDSEVPRLVAEGGEAIECLKYLDEEYLVRAGEQREDVFLILKGSCLVQRQGAGAERRSGDELAVIEATPEAPVFIGETAYLSGGPRTASVRCALSVWVLRMPPAQLDFIIARFPELTRTLCRQFARRLKETNAALAQMREGMAMDVSNDFTAAGAVVFERGTPCESLYILVDGVVSIEDDDGSRDVRPTGSGPCFLNAAAFLRQTTHGYTARAKSACIINAIPMTARIAAIRNFPQIVDAA